MPQIKGKEYKNSSLKHNGLKNGALFCFLSRGSLTVETALVLPLFLFAMVTVLFLFRVSEIQYVVGEALDKAVAEAALQKELLPQEVENAVKQQFYKELAKENRQISMINLEWAGFSWENSGVDEAYINMEMTYQVKLPGWIWKGRRLAVTECSRSRRWTGMSGAGANGSCGEWVYITPEGSVYHRSRECTHLKLSIQSVAAKDAEGYRPCELCGKEKGETPFVYITQEGECYHSKLNCSGLKRTVYMVPLTQAEGRSPCSRCGGR